MGQRLGAVIENLINEDQVGYKKGRNIATNIRTIDDTINYLNSRIKSTFIMAIDYQKALDSILKQFMIEVLKKLVDVQILLHGVVL